MKKMKLQGSRVKNLTAKQKAKLKKTLSDMEKIRIEDSIRLRLKIGTKIVEYKEEIKKSDKIDKQLREQLRQIQIQRNRIEGAIVALSDILTVEEKDNG